MGVFTENYDKFEPKTEIKFEGSKKEEELEELLTRNPTIFPVNQIANSPTWIPLARQISIKNHGTLDILATDSDGNIYIVECKIKGNQDMKTIRGQITDYVAGLWTERGSWKDFLKSIEERSLNKKGLNEILKDNVEDIQDALDNIKQNFENGNYFLIYAVDQITPGLREVINWHNEKLDQTHQYPSFAIEVKKFVGDNNLKFIVTQNFPFNLDEIKREKEKTENRKENSKTDWEKIFGQTQLTDEERSKTLEFVKSVELLIIKDGGKINYGTGKNMPRMMPKFTSTSLRSGIGLKANGKLVLQFNLLRGEYPDEAEIFKEKMFEISEIKKEVEKSRSKGEFAIDSKIWLPHKDKILLILEQIFIEKQ